MRDGKIRLGFKALPIAIILSFSAVSYAGTGPLPPQGPGTADGNAYNGAEYGAEIDPGSSLFVDPNIGGILGPCRYVVVSPSDPSSAWIPLNTEQEWSYYRAGVNSGSPPPYVTEFDVCCRSQTVTMCKGAAGGTVNETLPYMITGLQQSLTATCLDQWGKTYTDTETWGCVASGFGGNADGVWSENGGGNGDVWGCSPNAYTSGCTAQCGGGSETIYDSCGNVQGTQSCNTQPCCTPNASVSLCSAQCGGGTQVVYDSCGNQTGSQACNTQNCWSCPSGTYQSSIYLSGTESNFFSVSTLVPGISNINADPTCLSGRLDLGSAQQGCGGFNWTCLQPNGDSIYCLDVTQPSNCGVSGG